MRTRTGTPVNWLRRAVTAASPPARSTTDLAAITTSSPVRGSMPIDGVSASAARIAGWWLVSAHSTRSRLAFAPVRNWTGTRIDPASTCVAGTG